MPSNRTENTAAATQAAALYRYLRDLVALRTVTTKDLDSYLDVFWFHDVPHEPECVTATWDDEAKGEERSWLRIDKAPKPVRPPLPDELLEWISDVQLDDATSDPVPREEIKVTKANTVAANDGQYTEPATEALVRFSDVPELGTKWQNYLEKQWQPWQSKMERYERVHHAYRKLFQISQQLDRGGEQVELVLGLGVVGCRDSAGLRIFHPVIVGRVTLSLEAATGRLELAPADQGIDFKLEYEILDPSERPPADKIRDIQSLVSEIESPWDREAVFPILAAWLNSMPTGESGGFSDSLKPPERVTTTPQLTYSPVLILRRRTAHSLRHALEKAAESVEKHGHLTDVLKEALGIRSPSNESGPRGEHSGREPEPVLFPLPSNDEQMQIVERLDRSAAVLVQGPPGTGKSHTIVNLLCHLLAAGNRVLVTSQTPRALRVLRKMMPDEIRPLAVSLLGEDQESRQNLEESVQGILQHVNSTSLPSLEKRIKELNVERTRCQGELAALLRRICDLRAKESQSVHVAESYCGTPQSIANELSSDRGNAWWEIDVQSNSSCPLSAPNLGDLCRLISEFGNSYDQAAKCQLPACQNLPTADAFATAVARYQAAKSRADNFASHRGDPRIATLQARMPHELATLRDLCSRLTATITESVRAGFSWVDAALRDAVTGKAHVWRSLLASSLASIEAIDVLARGPAIPTAQPPVPAGKTTEAVVADAEALLNHLRAGKGFGFWIFRSPTIRRTEYLWKDTTWHGKPLVTAEAVAEYKDALLASITLESTWNEWAGHVEPPKGTFLNRLAILHAYVAPLDKTLAAGAVFEELRSMLTTWNLPTPQIDPLQTASDHLGFIAVAETFNDEKAARADLVGLIGCAKAVCDQALGHSLAASLVAAAERGQVSNYRALLQELQQESERRDRAVRCCSLAQLLRQSAPRFFARLHDEPFRNRVLDNLGEWENAWCWWNAQLWVDAFVAAHSPVELEAEVQKKESSLRNLTSKLAGSKAWLSCLLALQHDQYRQGSLVAWKQTIARLGKGTGTHAETHRRTARKYLQESRTAIPAWIMPFYRVAEQVEIEPGAFDVAIIDEASQTGPEGLLVFFLAKKVIVVGDDKQISPNPGFVDQNEVQALIRQHLREVAFGDTMLPTSSLFHQTAIRFGNRLTLREHFRCMPEIIRFSNDLCYRDTPLIPLRQYPPDRLEPLQTRFVRDGFREGRGQNVVNRQEAAAIVLEISKCLADPRYAGKSFGVISLLGEGQARLIERWLLEKVGPEPFSDSKRRLRCGDAYSFQGDERDVMFLSMAASLGGVRLTPLASEQFRQRFNVAASRARDQMWLFHSIRESDLHPECMRRRLLQFIYAEVPPIPVGDLDRCESQFERDVGVMLVQRGVAVQPQFPVAEYRIDFVAQGRIAIECDGDAFHGPEQYEADMARQRMLERCGWKFIRIGGTQFYCNRERTIDYVMKELRRFGGICQSEPTTRSSAKHAIEISGNDCLATLGIIARGSQPDAKASDVVPETLDDDAEFPAAPAEDETAESAQRTFWLAVPESIKNVNGEFAHFDGLDNDSKLIYIQLQSSERPLSRIELADATGISMQRVARSTTSLIQSRRVAEVWEDSLLKYKYISTSQ